MLPSIAQFRKWSLPSKYTFIAFIVFLVTMIYEGYYWIVSVPEYAILASNSGNSEMTIYGAAGDTMEAAVIIRGAKSRYDGISAEHDWIKRRFPSYKIIGGVVLTNNDDFDKNPVHHTPVYFEDILTGVKLETSLKSYSSPPRYYSKIEIRNWYGRTRNIYFDIDSYFSPGKKEKWKKIKNMIRDDIPIQEIGIQFQEKVLEIEKEQSKIPDSIENIEAYTKSFRELRGNYKKKAIQLNFDSQKTGLSIKEISENKKILREQFLTDILLLQKEHSRK